MTKAFGAAIRNLRRAPAFTALVVLTLALGIGATTAMFSVVDAVLLRPLPYPNAGRFSQIWMKIAGDTFPGVPETVIARFRAELADIADVEGYQMGASTITGGKEPEIVGAPGISPRMLTLVGATPHLGRLFTDEDATSASPVVIISYRAWTTMFGSDPAIVGRQIEIDDRPHTVIGVMSPRMRFPEANAAIWRPINLAPSSPTRRRVMPIVVRHSGVTRDQLDARLAAISSEFVEAKLLPAGQSIYADILLQERAGQRSERSFWLMFGAVVIVLLVACVNVSNLLLARASHHHGEFAVRSALGASRARLVGMSLTESLILVTAGGAAGVVVARVLLSVLLEILPPQLTFLTANGSELDLRVLTFAVVTSLATCLVAGLLPMWRASRVDPLDAIKQNSRTVAGRDQWWQATLITAQLSLVLVLLAGAGLLMRSFIKLSSVDTGFQPEGLSVVTVELPTRRYDQGGLALQFVEQVEQRLEAMGDMQVTIASGAPLTQPAMSFGNTPEAEDGKRIEFSTEIMPWSVVAPDYFQTVGIPMLLGRTFEAGDGEDAIVINNRLATTFWGDASPLGKHFRLGEKHPRRTVIGVVADVRQGGLDDPYRHGMEFYIPQSRKQGGGHFAVLIRSSRDPDAVMNTAKQLLWSLDPKLPVDAMPMRQELAESLYRQRFFLRLSVAFTLIATSLAMVGVYGAFAYWVERRRRELAIRMAIGAAPAALVKAIVGKCLRLTAAGVLIGAAIALGGARVLESMLFDVDPRDPITLALVVLSLVAAATVSCLVPALRASRIDPMTTLRAE